MNLIPFVKSNSPTLKTATQSDEEITTTLSPSSPIDEGNVGLKVAEIYQSIVSLKTTTKTTSPKAQHDSSSGTKETTLESLHNNAFIYCDSCDMIVRDPGHFRGTAHLVSTQTPQPSFEQGKVVQQPEGTQPPPNHGGQKTITRLELEHGKDSAMQLMEKYGWRPGEGLGKSNQGVRYPVTTVWKQDRLGIGHPRTDRRRITHPSITKTIHKSNKNNTSSGSVSGKKLAADAKAEAALRSAMLNYMNN